MEKIEVIYTKTGQEPKKYKLKNVDGLKTRAELLGMILLLKEEDIKSVFSTVVEKILY